MITQVLVPDDPSLSEEAKAKIYADHIDQANGPQYALPHPTGGKISIIMERHRQEFLKKAGIHTYAHGREHGTK